MPKMTKKKIVGKMGRKVPPVSSFSSSSLMTIISRLWLLCRLTSKLMGLAVEAGKHHENMYIARTGIFIGLLSVVTTVIYFTPVPDEHETQSCLRPCHALDWPMICRFQIRIHQDYPNTSFLANSHFSGPDIQVCKNDILLIDIINRVPDRSLTIHWRGQDLKETPQMDGASMITQCPILPFTTFQYKLRASVPGTHVYHTQDNSIFGALIVRQSDWDEPQRHMYDFDNPDHVISIHSRNKRILINSSNQDVNLNVHSGVSYRFRVISLHEAFCAIRLTVEQHSLTIIALDGQSFLKTNVDSVDLFSGERADFVLKTDQPIGKYKIHVTPLHGCTYFSAASAKLIYKNPINFTPTKFENKKFVESQFDALNQSQTDHLIYIYFGIKVLTNENSTTHLGFINNRTMLLPPSPIISQLSDINRNVFCPDDLQFCQTLYENICECVHILEIPLGESVELVFSNEGDFKNKWHVFHIHGHYFYMPKNNVIKDTISVPPSQTVLVRFLANNPGFWLLEGDYPGMQLLFQIGTLSDLPPTPSNFPKCGDWIGPKYFLT